MRSILAKMFYLIVLFISILPVITSAQHSIGVVSTVVDLGTLQSGSDNTANFHLVTTSRESFSVALNKEYVTVDFFHRMGYSDYLSNYSEEDVMDWVEFFTNSVQIEPLGTEGSGAIGSEKEVNFIISIPEEAEPGYHVFKIKPLPIFSAEELGQVGATVISATTVTFLFNIEGKAIRDGLILDVVPGEQVGSKFVTDTYFQNTGTTTISALLGQGIYKDGKDIAGVSSSKVFVRPGKVYVFKSYFPGDKFSEGEYEVRTSVNFLTGAVYKNSTIYIEPSALPPIEEKPKFPWLIIVLILIILAAIIIYKIS